MHAVTLEPLEKICQAVAVRIVDLPGWSMLVGGPDMTNFATFTGTGNAKAPVAQRGKAEPETHRLAAGGAGPGGHPRRRDPADLARLPR